jgi:hypothetical protein
LTKKLHQFVAACALCIADKKSGRRGAENEAIFRGGLGQKTEAVAGVETVSCSRALEWALAKRALRQKTAVGAVFFSKN